jgi:hypothetical protein
MFLVFQALRVLRRRKVRDKISLLIAEKKFFKKQIISNSAKVFQNMFEQKTKNCQVLMKNEA